jgi:hypothetical protein
MSFTITGLVVEEVADLIRLGDGVISLPPIDFY